MKYLIDNEEVKEEKFWDEFENEVHYYVEDNLDDLIDDENDEVKIGSLTYSPSQVLKECDPVAYRCYEDDLFEYLYQDYKYELENTDSCTINSKGFEIVDEE